MRFILLIITTLLCTIASAQSSKKGGYIYGWNNYSNSNTSGLGNRTVNWDSTEVAQIKHAPAIGVHPRVYFGPSDIPEIKNRLDNTLSGNSVKASIRAYSLLLNLGSSYNQNASYAKDASGNRYIQNSGAWNGAAQYTKLVNQDPTVWNGVDIKRRHRTASAMSLEAFTCLLYPTETDPALGISNNQRAQNLATAMTFWANQVIGDPNVNPDSNNFNLLGGTHMALCYDLMYNNLTVAQRLTIRTALSQIIPDNPRHGGDTTAFSNTTNWSTLNSFEIIINLSMEGESGYKPVLTQEWMRSLHNFINYGWYDSGAGYEGLGKNYQFVTTLIACAKRGYSLLSHPHVRAYGEDFLPAIMQPFGKGFTSYDVWGGSGYDEVQGQYKFNAADAVGLKWAFPNSEKIDFVWRNYISSSYNNDTNGYVYAQIAPDDSYNNYLIPAAVFALDYSTQPWQAQANVTVETDFVADDRGLAVFKSSKDKNALAVQFHARQDLGGHTHGDRLDFTLSGLERIWIRKTYGGSQFQPSKYHSMVLIDDLGVAVGDPDGDKSRQPATVLNYSIADDISKIAADATYAYKWEWHWSARNASQNHPWLGPNGWQAVTETWNDFLTVPKQEAHFNIPFYDYPHWTQGNKLERMVKRLYNPVEKVVRNIGLIKGAHPMLLVVDDVKKDNALHNYKWTAQLARDLELDHYDVNLSNTNYKCDIILKEPVATGNRRLLIRILQNENYDGTTNPGSLEVLDYVDYFTGATFNPNPNFVRSRLVVESNSITPNFKVLIYPYTLGQELPTTNWNSSKTELQIQFTNFQKFVNFPKDTANNTQIELSNVTLSEETFELENNELFLYPNPASNQVKLFSSQGIKNVKIYDVLGRLISKKIGDNSSELSLNISNLNTGTYLIRVLNENGRKSTAKFFVK